jgi:tRNA threonylcarbamoyl adenosine modification protein YjeE
MAATETASPAETEALAAQLARRLQPGDVVLVSGELGAGKTTFVRGAARALGVQGPVTSPTFTIARRYEDGHVPISHLDLFRLEGLDAEEPELLADELAADRMATEARASLMAVGEATGHVERTTVLAGEVILAQLRSIVVDLLLLTGMDQVESTEALPPPPRGGD